MDLLAIILLLVRHSAHFDFRPSSVFQTPKNDREEIDSTHSRTSFVNHGRVFQTVATKNRRADARCGVYVGRRVESEHCA